MIIAAYCWPARRLALDGREGGQRAAGAY